MNNGSAKLSAWSQGSDRTDQMKIEIRNLLRSANSRFAGFISGANDKFEVVMREPLNLVLDSGSGFRFEHFRGITYADGWTATTVRLVHGKLLAAARELLEKVGVSGDDFDQFIEEFAQNVPPFPHTIVYRRYADFVKVWIEGNTAIWEAGPTLEYALGRFMLTRQSEHGWRIKEEDTSER